MRWRRTYLINWRLQLRYAALTSLISLMGTFAFAAVLYEREVSLSRVLAQECGVAVEDTGARMELVMWLVLGVFLTTTIGSVIVSILHTHQIAGPMLVIHRALGELLGGKPLSRKALRKGDEFTETYELIRTMEQRGTERDAAFQKWREAVDQALANADVDGARSLLKQPPTTSSDQPATAAAGS